MQSAYKKTHKESTTDARIAYPFAAIPNHIARGGHGAQNIAVLVALLSHGTVTASVATLAAEAGVDVKSVRSAIKYWLEHAKGVGIVMRSRGGGGSTGTPTIYEIRVLRMDEPLPKTVGGTQDTPTENGRGGLPKKVDPPLPKTVGKEEQVKKTNEEDTPLPPNGGDAEINRQVAEVMDVFVKTVSPTLSFGHVGQRNAAKRVIEAVGFERALNAARFAVTIQGKEFAPTITKPSELENKYGALQGFYRRESERAPQSITI